MGRGRMGLGNEGTALLWRSRRGEGGLCAIMGVGEPASLTAVPAPRSRRSVSTQEHPASMKERSEVIRGLRALRTAISVREGAAQ
jgi:hypothetical protein